ncbi:hypothetical protein VE04_08543 [Pseudogymnoascus sp. 24MN13]|nr:hypothetical protein VE04_08543 [Pseudogymnoascus sp. 24MN13]
MVKINQKFAKELISKLIEAANGATKLNVHDPDEIAKYALSTLALLAGLIPEIGSTVSSVITLAGQAFLPSGSEPERLWNMLRERIEELIGSKISDYHFKMMKAKIEGFQINMNAFSKVCKEYDEAKNENEKRKAANTVKTSHIAFLFVIRGSIPEFQAKDYEVMTLPLFALAATMHLMLLADGIKNGKDWGYSETNISGMRDEFKKLTSPGTVAKFDRQSLSDERYALQDAIKKGTEWGVPAKVLDTWHEAYSDRFGPKTNIDEIIRDIEAKVTHGPSDYVSYVWKYYEEGRKKVVPYKPHINEPENRGITAGARLRAYADYDSRMAMTVLNYAALWPFLAGEKITERGMMFLSREIFYGPFGRCTTVDWNESTPPKPSICSSRITSVYVIGGADIECTCMKYDNTWGHSYGKSCGGKPYQLDLERDEYVKSVETKYGHKLGCLKFVTNKDRFLKCGASRHADKGGSAAPVGYELTSVYITQFESHEPGGCEGIVLGFRPLLTSVLQD